MLQNIKKLHRIYEEEIPYNRELKIKCSSSNTKTSLIFNYSNNFAGNAVHFTLHGGITSCLIDISGGLTTASKLVLEEKKEMSLEQVRAISSRVATVNIRVDFLKPGIGTIFKATGDIVNFGKKLATVRMSLMSDLNKIIAIGIGTYTTGYCTRAEEVG